MSEQKDQTEAACGGSALTAELGADLTIPDFLRNHRNLMAEKDAEIKTLRRQFAIAKHQWDNWKEEAMRLNARLQKYEPGSPMLLNSKVPNK